MNQAKADAILSDIQTALREIDKKHGLVPSRIGGNWGADGSTKVSITMMEANSEGAKAAAEAGVRTDPKQLAHLKKHGWKFNLSITDVGKEFKIGARTYLFSGMSSSQFATAMNKADGKYYRLNPSDVRAGLGK